MRAAQSSAGVWGDTGGALVWGVLTAVLTLGGPGSEVTVVPTESGNWVLPPLFPRGTAGGTAAATAAALGSQGRVATPTPIHIGASGADQRWGPLLSQLPH